MTGAEYVVALCERCELSIPIIGEASARTFCAIGVHATRPGRGDGRRRCAKATS